VVIDRGVRIPEGFVVGEDPVLDAKRFRRSEGGVCLITQEMLDKVAQEPAPVAVAAAAVDAEPAGSPE